MIDKGHLAILGMISMLYTPARHGSNQYYKFICDAIESNINHLDNILYILQTYPGLTPLLIRAIEENFPQHLNRVEKLLPLA